MRGWRWMGVAAAAFALAAPVGAAGGAEGPRASEDACRAACAATVTRCAGVFGPALGDMRPPCERAVLRRCQAMGLQACDASGGGAAPPAAEGD